ncbi:EC1118_1N18_0452p [Saccharomyces cerevisiae EC1118]|uniref:Putative uncharacterized protein YNR005C n=2 Tax=Saccharomyces cerevisiae TaxID=4932 RepID=YN82_YEAST|nr:RecName: Full=Putative uncharacterized protein YNR005C [Saccharomyces cerevisiae S288C]AAT93346.1 YNR005C [Saccharomyces cerevisiae]CAA96281.1 unnamed protein product [Saccharomyces cerevisiae]CAY82198.1 EC1118_1N18_0452p [Saccharomyces cerevisiae EC1118]
MVFTSSESSSLLSSLKMTCSMVSMNSLEQISLIKGVPPFFTHILVSFQEDNWVFGLSAVLRILFFIQRIESLGFTLLDLNTSEISNAMGRSRSPLGMLSLVACSINASNSLGVLTDILFLVLYSLLIHLSKKKS